MSSSTNSDSLVRARAQWEYHLLHHDEEVSRLTAQHEVLWNSLGKLAFAPVDWSRPNLMILDSATADGQWLRDLRNTLETKYPEASHTYTYIGIDSVQKFFPEPSTIPSNLSFKIQRIDDPWPPGSLSSFPKFDYIHQRFVLPACEKIPKRDAVLNLAAQLAPGGYIELVENDHDRPASESGGFAKGEDMFRRIFKITGGDHEYPKMMKGWLEEAGLVDVKEEIVQVPIGRMNENPEMAFKSTWSICSALRGLLPMARALPLGFTNEELDDIPDYTQRELDSQGGLLTLFLVYGRK